MKDKIIFFDGICNLCNGFIRMVLRCNKKDDIYVSRLQSDRFSALKEKAIPQGITKLTTICYYRHSIIYRQSKAIVMILKDLGGAFGLFGQLISLFPLSFSNYIYTIIAQNRYKIFGKRDSCPLPTTRQKKMFLT